MSRKRFWTSKRIVRQQIIRKVQIEQEPDEQLQPEDNIPEWRIYVANNFDDITFVAALILFIILAFTGNLYCPCKDLW